MAGLVTYLDPQPAGETMLPGVMPSPFSSLVHPVARRAAEVLQTELQGGLARWLGLATDGKMFGVLVVADPDGRIGFLRAFSGMVNGTWSLAGFVPPAFDLAVRDSFWIDGERELIDLQARLDEASERIAPVQAELDALNKANELASDELRAKHRANRDKRHAERATTSDPIRLRALDQESRGDTAERRAFDARHRASTHELELKLRVLDGERAALEARRADRSRHFLERIHATYALVNAHGALKPLRDLYAPAEPPGGAGDCAAPKLLACAYRERLRPIALAEFWWGAAPATGGRLEGVFYPACRGKCGPILTHMLDGIAHEPAPIFGTDPFPPDVPSTVLEDQWLVVIDKPAGMLSVPGRSGLLTDSVLTRLRTRYPDATGAVIVHRLDLDASGLMLAAKGEATYAALQRLFARREVDKRYIAWLEGEVAGEAGVIELPIRVDVDDRPRQIVDLLHGKAAVTEWSVLAREGRRTRVALQPRTGRTHQLRVHAAVGLGAPIVGDRLYGRPDARLMLHAEAIAFVHPHTHDRIELTRPAPF